MKQMINEGLSQELLENDEIMNKFAQDLGNMAWANGKDINKAVMDEEVYWLNQNGYCKNPSIIKSTLNKIWPEVQKLAKEKYGYNGVVWSAAPSVDELPEYLKEKAEIIKNCNELMEKMADYLLYYKNCKNCVKGAAMNVKNEMSVPCYLAQSATHYTGVKMYLTPNEAKRIIVYLKKDLSKIMKELNTQPTTVNEGKTKRHNGPKDEMAAMKHADWEKNKDNYIKGGLHKTAKLEKKPKYKPDYLAAELDEMVEKIYNEVINELKKRQ